MHAYEVRPRKDKRGVDLISKALPFGRLWYAKPNAVSNAIGYAKFFSRSHDAVIRVYDDTGDLNLSKASCCFYSSASKVLLVRHAAPHVEIAFATIKGNKAGAEPAAYPRRSAR